MRPNSLGDMPSVAPAAICLALLSLALPVQAGHDQSCIGFSTRAQYVFAGGTTDPPVGTYPARVNACSGGPGSDFCLVTTGSNVNPGFGTGSAYAQFWDDGSWNTEVDWAGEVLPFFGIVWAEGSSSDNWFDVPGCGEQGGSIYAFLYGASYSAAARVTLRYGDQVQDVLSHGPQG